MTGGEYTGGMVVFEAAFHSLLSPARASQAY